MNKHRIVPAILVNLLLGAVALSATALAQDSDEQEELRIQPPQLPAQQAQAAPMEEVIAIGRSYDAAEQLVNERIDDSTMVDLLGAAAISRLGDSTVAAALRRVPGLTLVNDKFVYIRGLGERYSASSLNGAQIPSPDLTRNVIPLDIFPTSIVESLRVQKAYSPNLSANFGGGSIDIRTRGIPEDLVVDFEISGGANSQTSGTVLSYPGGNDDDFGTDSGARALPNALLGQIDRFQGNVDVQGIFSTLRTEDPSLSIPQALGQARSLNRQLGLLLNRQIGLEQKDPHPDLGLKASFGNNFELSNDWEVGFLAGGSYQTGWRETEAVSRNFRFPEERTDTEQESTRSINIAGTLNFGIRFTDDHEVTGSTLFLRSSDDETAIRDFFNENRERSDGLGFRNTRLEFEERNMLVNQLKATHVLGEETRERLPSGLARLINWVPTETEISWFYSKAKARTDIPNRVDIESQTTTDVITGAVLDSAVSLDATAADFRFTDLDDQVDNYGWGVIYPLTFGNSFVELGFGYEHSRKSREYRQSQFSLGPLNVGDPAALQGSLDTVFSEANILNPDNNFVFDIQGTNNQSYLAATMTEAAYGYVDWNWKETWRLAAGARWEDYKQVAVDWNPFGYTATDPQISTDPAVLANGAFQTDEIFPSVSLTYMTSWWAENFQLRFGFSETAIRPDLREITDASYIDPRTDDLVDGNPGVIPAAVSNFDVRGEWFFASGDNLTVTLFYKDIDSPIEFFESAASDTTTAREIINAQSAEVYGVELEGLKTLGFLGSYFANFFMQANLTLQDSELVAGIQADAPTNPVRKLTGASDYLANISLGFDSADAKHTASLAYNVFGDRLYVAGRNGAPDGFEQPFHSLDLVYSWFPTDTLTVKAKVQNMLGERIEIQREGVVSFLEDPGSTFAISFRWAL